MDWIGLDWIGLNEKKKKKKKGFDWLDLKLFFSQTWLTNGPRKVIKLGSKTLWISINKPIRKLGLCRQQGNWTKSTDESIDQALTT